MHSLFQQYHLYSLYIMVGKHKILHGATRSIINHCKYAILLTLLLNFHRKPSKIIPILNNLYAAVYADNFTLWLILFFKNIQSHPRLLKSPSLLSLIKYSVFSFHNASLFSSCFVQTQHLPIHISLFLKRIRF